MVFRHQIDVKGPRGGVRGVIPTKQAYLSIVASIGKF